jgi:hypothetical protein
MSGSEGMMCLVAITKGPQILAERFVSFHLVHSFPCEAHVRRLACLGHFYLVKLAHGLRIIQPKIYNRAAIGLCRPLIRVSKSPWEDAQEVSRCNSDQRSYSKEIS